MGRKESNQSVNKQNSMCGLSSCESPYLLILKSISLDIWQHKYLLAFKPCENCYSQHDNMTNTTSIVVAAIDSEYFAIIFALSWPSSLKAKVFNMATDTRFAE